MPLDPTKLKAKHTFNAPCTFFGMAYDAVSNRAYCGGDDNLVYVFDLATAAKKFEPVAKWNGGHDNYISCVVAIERAGKKLVVTGGYDKNLVWWNPDKGEVVRTVPAHGGWVRDLIATPDGSKLISCGDDMLVKVWDADTGKPIATLDGHAKLTPQGHVTALYALAISRDGQLVASADRHGDVRVWNLADGKQIGAFAAPTLYTYDARQRKRSLGGIRAVAFSPDASLIAVGGMGQVDNVDGLAGKVRLEVWEWRKPLARFTSGAENHTGMIGALQFHPKEPWLVGSGGGGDNAFVAFWKTDVIPAEIDPKQKADPVKNHRIKGDGFFHRLATLPGGTEFVTAGHKKFIVWTTEEKKA